MILIISTGPEGSHLQVICSNKNIFHIASYHNPDPSYKAGMKEVFGQLRWLNPFNLGEWCRHLYLYFEWTRLKKADLVHCLSEYQKKLTCEHLDIPENKVTVIYCGVDIEKFFPVPDGDQGFYTAAGLSVKKGSIIFWRHFLLSGKSIKFRLIF